MPNQSTVAIVFQDLSDSLDVLCQARSSPKDVRRAFSRFVELTQKLTSAMRNEFPEFTGQRWNAVEFGGWNNISELFKELRNVDQHEPPITIQVHERQYYPVELTGTSSIVIEATWDVDDQLSNRPPKGMDLVPADHDTGEPSKTETYIMERREYDFHLRPRTQNLEAMLSSIHTRNIHLLADRCFTILQDYYSFYLRKVESLTR